MHVWFRQYAQQMGLQNVRAILPEQIDNLINTSIRDTIDEIVRTNIGTTNDRVITDNSKIANINALRTLYRVKTLDASVSSSISNLEDNKYSFDSSNITNALYFVDFAVRYVNINDANKKSRWFPIRVIDDSFLADVLNDWILAPRLRTPVMVVYKAEESAEQTLDTAVATAYLAYKAVMDNPSSTEVQKAAALTAYKNAKEARTSHLNETQEITTFDIYFGDNDSIASIAASNRIYQIRCSYIKKPNKVQLLSDLGSGNVDSDLPEQLQIPMLKHAVDLYRVTVQGALFANQQNAQANQQEIARNNARPENEGYQS